jgi:hypothetical protein
LLLLCSFAEELKATMMKQRLSLVSLVFLMSLAGSHVVELTAQQSQPTAAGSITALLPVAKILRGSGSSVATADAQQGEAVFWNDLIRTEKSGRARITLADQSILSLGSQSELRILNHDARSQQTALQLATGRMRSQVTSITRPGGKFEVRTTTAVAGVIGTDFGIDASVPGTVTFVCISGITRISNIDPAVPGAVDCTAGKTVAVVTGQPPSPPKDAAPEQIEQMIQATEPTTLSSLPQPRIVGDEHSFDVGTSAYLDARPSVGADGAPIAGYKWELCEPGYQPTELGVPFEPGKKSSCQPLQNVTSKTPEFRFDTCELAPQDHIARLTVTDENRRSAAVEYRVRVYPENYPNPEQVVRGVADAFEALQANRFVEAFSESYLGYTELTENMRRTMDSLQSMNINLRVLQSSRRCNESVVRADWKQNYVLRNGACAAASPSGSCTQDEQLTVRLVRTPGVGWKIVEFNGDNGALLGLSPRPSADAVFSIAAADNNGRAAPTGMNAFQIGETPTPEFRVTIVNQGTHTVPGNLQLQMTCTPACPGEPFTASVVAPAASGSDSALIPFNTSGFSPGTHTPIFSITSIPGGAVGTGRFTGATFELADFSIANTSPFSGQITNIPANGTTGLFAFALGYTGSPKLLNVSTFDNGGTSTRNFLGGPIVAPGNYAVGIQSLPATAAGTNEVIRIEATNFGVTRSVSQNVRFYDAQIVQTTTALGGDSSANPVMLTVGDPTGVSINFRLQGTFDTSSGPAIFEPLNNLGPHLTATLASPAPGIPGDVFTIHVVAANGAPIGTPQAVNLSLLIPNTDSHRRVTAQLWIQATGPAGLANLGISNVTPVAGRSFNAATPLIWGEASSVDVTVVNTGVAPSPAGIVVRVLADESVTATPVGQVAIGSINPSGSVTVNVPFVFPDPPPAGFNGRLVVDVSEAPGQLDLSTNVRLFPVASSDWGLQVVGPGTKGNPLPIIGQAGTSPVTIIQAGPLSGGSLINDVNAGAMPSSHVGLVPFNFILNAANTFAQVVNLQADGTAQDGPLAVNLVGIYGSSRRGVTVHGDVTGSTLGAPGHPGVVTITANPPNASPGDNSGCVSGCTPLQVNGIILESVDLTPTNSITTAGEIDMVFTDTGGIVSNLDTSGTQLSPVILAMPYGSTQPVLFGAVANAAGNVAVGPAEVVISPGGITTSAVPTFPPPDKVGTQQTTLYFNVGDINITQTPACVAIPPGTTVNVDIDFATLGGFNEPSFDYTLSNPTSFNLVLPSGTVAFSAGYPRVSLPITNLETNPGGRVELALHLTFTRMTPFPQTVTKTFPLQISLSGICILSADGTSFKGGVPGTWSRGQKVTVGLVGPVLKNMTRPAQRTQGTPDLQLRATDVSFSPSTPVVGDTVQVRFKVANVGNGDAINVPIALVANGQQVASSTFDVPAGSSTLAALDWNTAGSNVPHVAKPISIHTRSAAHRQRLARKDREIRSIEEPIPDPVTQSPPTDVRLIIDPAGTVRQKTTENKSVALTQLHVRPGLRQELAQRGMAEAAAGSFAEHVWLEIADVCVGLRMPLGTTTGCEGSELDLHVEDAGSGKYALSSIFGVADLGNAGLDPTGSAIKNAQFASRVPLLAGHTYAVRDAAGAFSVFTLSQVLSPQQFAILLRQKFHRSVRRMARNLGGDSAGIEAGDVSGYDPDKAIVYFDLALRNPSE